jgi:hypothetical protein
MSTPRVIWVVALAYGVTWCGSVTADEPRVERLVRLLGSENFDERERAVKELIDIGAPAMEALRKAAASTDAEVAMRAKACIPEIECNEKVLILVRRLTSPAAAERAQAVSDLAPFGPRGYKAVPALVSALDDSDIEVRTRVINTLGGMGPGAAPAVPRLIRLLQDKKQRKEDRLSVAIALGRIGPTAQEAVPVLLQILESEDDYLQKGAVFALPTVGRGDKRVAPALIKALGQTDRLVQERAALALGRFGQDPEKVVPTLVEVLKKHKWDPERAELTRCVMIALGHFASQAQPAVPDLVEIVLRRDADMELRNNAVTVLNSIGPAARTAVPALKAWVKKNESEAHELRIPELIEQIERPR